MVSRSGGRARRLIITAMAAAGIGAGISGVALASTGGSGAASSTTARTTATSSSPSSSASSRAHSSMPAGASGRTHHHCTHMGSTPGSSARPGTSTG